MFTRLLPWRWWALALLLGACHNAPSTTASPPCPPPAPFAVRHPAWAASASLYQVNVRQYTPEGTFRAFEAHLPRLHQMGVGILWLMPVQPIGVARRKGTLGSPYSVRDYYGVNPELGSLADLQHLVGAAHRLGMHVILDWVADHTSWDSRLSQEHPDWFAHDAQGRFVPPVADWQDVIALDYGRPGLRRYMAESMAYWVRDVGFDGFRCDVAGLVPTDFWNAARAGLEKIKPVFMLAEWDELYAPPFLKKGAFTPRTHLLEQAFDATYALRLHYLLDSIAQHQKPVAALPAYFAAERRRYPAGVYLMNFTSSHDANAWDGPEGQRLGADARALAVLTALLPGIPLVYSGQEAASAKRLRFFDKDTIAWKGHALNAFYTNLLHLKHDHPALRNGDACARFTLLPAPAGCFAFERATAGNRARVWVAVNLGPVPQRLGHPAATDTDAFADLGPPVTETQVTVPPHGWRVLTTRQP
ncbi:alpha-amylase family glycosyl hydrolase [Hymenobacter caeli]|uniref:Glycosyl hydrolase family 13 catalytic domain-containing protein n=1 Tax=Hymenobacter caeli TaxID=2735894 RepID=A0ABX2FS32_9BACT|nr:alpha-amylase family glycosyl hydrolase [Hymenobacter caeli]NRT19992.1 hypothetical protein [Hymenobacter caeli]